MTHQPHGHTAGEVHADAAADRGGADETRRRLMTAPFELVGQFADASNTTLLVVLTDRGAPRPAPDSAAIERADPADLAVYKPQRGEAPLWDFPSGTLHQREVAAYEVSCSLGWDLVPTTVLRADGPLGAGSLQRYVPHDPERHYFSILEEGDEALVEQLRRMAVFDLVIDNADRKGGHVLLERERIRLIDHGVTFNVAPRLRTVAWHFAGEPIPADSRSEVAAAARRWERDPGVLADLLCADEREALVRRARRVADLTVFPAPEGRRPYPWPLL